MGGRGEKEHYKQIEQRRPRTWGAQGCRRVACHLVCLEQTGEQGPHVTFVALALEPKVIE